ncbi:GH25 family lysozyme [Acinetobacter equi]|uniref:glycoside hydrolase family 25 protein n=1 Tax=Acinetobacter equi TaxID=1324350 RepID=UPI0009D72830|nr:GH25 family lysozyme [Acinetobacter equi]
MTKPKLRRLSKTFWGSLFGLSSLIIALCLYLFIYPQNTLANEYTIYGFDVSHHQGDIQWNKISPTRYKFVYLKATEGGDFKDRKFSDNWLQARENGFLVGAYHFYRLCKDGRIQANNFIETVPKKENALPPVIDLEYDSNCINTFTKEQLLQEIQIMHDKLYEHYEKQPIFYISKSFYNIVLADNFKQTPLWVREYQGKPNLKNDPSWLFWQHTNKGKILGIKKTVDLNVFNGDEKDWGEFLKQNKISQASP